MSRSHAPRNHPLRNRGAHARAIGSGRFRVPSLAALAAAVVLTGAACAAPAADDPDTELIRIAVDLLPSDWNSAAGTRPGGDLAVQAVMSGLFYWDEDGVPQPVIGSSYEVSEDRRSVEVTLYEGLEFSDGSALDADAVIAFYEKLLAEDSQHFLKSQLLREGPVFTIVDDVTFRIDFDVPTFHPDDMVYDTLRTLFETPILSTAALADPEAATADPMSVGPYLIEERSDTEMTLVRNSDYWDPESYPYDTIVLKVLPDAVAKLNALKSGQVDVARLNAEYAAEAESSGFDIHVSTPVYTTLMIRNPEESAVEALRDARVRQALMLAFDREAINATIDLGFGYASSQAFRPGQDQYIEGGDERYGYDPERARELLAEAGYPDGFDLVIPSFGNDSVEPIVQQSLADIGIRVTYPPLADGGEYFQAIASPEYGVSLFANHYLNTVRLLDEEFTGVGRIFDQNDEIDRLIALLKRGDSEESAAASQELGEKILGEVWYVPISHPPVIWGSAPGYAVGTDDALGGGYWLSQFRPEAA